VKVSLQLPLKARAARLPPIIASEEDFGPWVLLRSSNLRACRYRDTDRMLDVVFHSGALYRYTHVPGLKYTALVDAPSAGQCFEQTIKKIHAATKLAG